MPTLASGEEENNKKALAKSSKNTPRKGQRTRDVKIQSQMPEPMYRYCQRAKSHDVHVALRLFKSFPYKQLS